MEQRSRTPQEASTQLSSMTDGGGFDPIEHEIWKAKAYNEAKGRLNEEDGYDCPVCRNKGWIMEAHQAEQLQYWACFVHHCPCGNIRKSIGDRKRSGLNKVRKYTFDNYKTGETWQENVKKTALRFCGDLDRRPWFFIGGQSGAGKTHICTAITDFCIDQQFRAHYMVWRDESTRIKGLQTDQAKYQEKMTMLKTVPVLYIDDIFKGSKDESGKFTRPSNADVTLAFEIINSRYNNQDLITIISSERTILEMDEIDSAVAGRIAERASEGGYIINLNRDQKKNYRMRNVMNL